jgi:DHA1 family bicyclomycin/chloramphenicol resistance-like MFS transporter
VQLTLSVFLAGFACGQIVLRTAFRSLRTPAGLMLSAGWRSTAWPRSAASLPTASKMLIAARFVQALGACAGPVLGRAIVRDVWGATDSARIIAYMGGAMAIAPLLGPTLGGFPDGALRLAVEFRRSCC